MPRKNPNTAGDAQLAKGLQNNEGQMQKMRKDPTYSPTPEVGSSGNRAAQKGNARSTAPSKPKVSRPTPPPLQKQRGTGMTPPLPPKQGAPRMTPSPSPRRGGTEITPPPLQKQGAPRMTPPLPPRRGGTGATAPPPPRRGGTGATAPPPIRGKVTTQQPGSASAKQRSEKAPVPKLDPKKNKALISGLQGADNKRELDRIGRTPGASPRPMPKPKELVKPYTGKVAVKANPKKLKP